MLIYKIAIFNGRYMSISALPTLRKYFLKHLSSMSSVADDVLVEKINNNVTLTLNRPKSLNALNLSMIRKINPLMKKWHQDKDVKMIIIKGSGEKAFCAGGDIRAISNKSDKTEQQNFFKGEYTLNLAIGSSKIPWVALIDGITMGGGFGLSVHGHFRVATEKTLFAMPETAIGLIPDVGGGYFLPRLANNIGTYLALTGSRLKGKDVQISGVATHFIEYSKLKDLEHELLNMKDANLKSIKDILDKYHEQCSLEKNKSFIWDEHIDKIKSIFSHDNMEDIMDHLKSDKSQWAEEQLKILYKMSPTSLKLTCEQLKRGRTLNLKEVLTMEYRIVQRLMQGTDFYEGVRAVLIDKDMKPNWNPKSLDLVKKDFILSHFEPAPDGDIKLEPL